MWRHTVSMGVLILASTPALAQTMTFSTSNSAYQVTTVFNEVDVFDFDMEINAPLAARFALAMTSVRFAMTYRWFNTLSAGSSNQAVATGFV